MSVSNLNLNIQTFMSVGYHIFKYIYRDKPSYKDVYRDKHEYEGKLKVTYSFNLSTEQVYVHNPSPRDVQVGAIIDQCIGKKQRRELQEGVLDLFLVMLTVMRVY